MENRKQKALELFKNKYNCAQSIIVAYCDKVGLTEEMAIKLTSGFGGGVASLGRTCGTVNAGVMLLSLKFGSDNVEDVENKNRTRFIIRSFISEFEEKHSSQCLDILTKEEKRYTMHSEKCESVVALVCDLLEKYMEM